MEVILNESVPALGFVGDIVRVRSGYARNYLIPRGLALESSRNNAKIFAHRKRVLEIKRAALFAEAKNYQAKLEALTLVIEKQAHEGKLYGSVTAADLAEALEKQGIVMDRKLISLAAPIKTVGVHTASVKLHPELIAALKVDVRIHADA